MSSTSTNTETIPFAHLPDIASPFLQSSVVDTLVQVRTGKIRPLYSTPATSAIYKTPHEGPVQITALGCEGDEHASKDHGGYEKALLHYCSQHYAQWQKECPESAHRFNIGGFGENIVTAHLSEHNVCIGDVYRFGSEVIVQVTEPRMPCYKLNHRFEVRDLAKQAQEKNRTGWMYRVLQPGHIQAGDQVALSQRPHPKWTIEAVQRYLHKDKRNVEAMQELVELPELGKEIKTLFANRLKQQYENENERIVGDNSMVLTAWSEYKVAEKRKQTDRIFSFILEAMTPVEPDRKIDPGSHVRLKLPGKLMRAYSVVGGTTNRFEIGIALDSNSRGGSRYLHDVVKPGEIMSASQVVCSFPLVPDADHHILIAGGIGITAFTAAAEQLQANGQSYALHLAVRSANEIPFQQRLESLSPNLTIHDRSIGQGLDLKQIISNTRDTTHIYCCGPPRLMDGVTAAAIACSFPTTNLHFETFQITTSGDPFTAEIANRSKTVEVNGKQTLLEALRDAGLDVDSSCETGNCGTCRVHVCDGRIEHRGTGLLETEKPFAMLSCVSRGIGHIVIEA